MNCASTEVNLTAPREIMGFYQVRCTPLVEVGLTRLIGCEAVRFLQV